MSKKVEKFVTTEYSPISSRRDYSKYEIKFEEPDLLDLQIKSYEKFLKEDLEKVVSTFFPIQHPKNDKYTIIYNGLKLDKPSRTEEEARSKGKTYEASLYVDLSLVNNETGEIKRVKKTKKKGLDGVFFANIPLMTKKGTFIINGIEKIVVSQIVRSPGPYILSKSKIKLNTKKVVSEGFICEFLPYRGNLFNIVFDDSEETIKMIIRNSQGDNVSVFYVTEVLKAFGLSQEEILRIFKDNVYIINSLFRENYNRSNILDEFELLNYRKFYRDGMSIEKIISSGSPIDIKLKTSIVTYEELLVNLNKTKSVYEDLLEKFQSGISKVTKKQVEDAQEKYQKVEEKAKNLLDAIIIEKSAKDIINTLSISTRSIEQYGYSEKNKISYQEILLNHFMSPRQYDLSSAGRYKTNYKFRISERLYQRVLAEDILDKNKKVVLKKDTLILKNELDILKKHLSENNLSNVIDNVSLSSLVPTLKKQDLSFESISVYTNNTSQDTVTQIIGLRTTNNHLSLTIVDIIAAVSYVLNLNHDIGTYDDIDHLGNKRLRLIHEQLKSKLQAGMASVERQTKEKLGSVYIATANEEEQAKINSKLTVKSLVNTKSLQLVIKTFFNTYQLTQFVDQQNPLSELTNKRRISAMGDGGISRDDPNLNIRDVHYSHYGRICPIETPEGMNIGLIMSLAAFTKIDENGFLTTPCFKVVKGVIKKDEVYWLSPIQENEYIIAQSNVNYDKNFKITDEKVMCRYRSNQELITPEKIDFIDISPRQIVSVATGAIPFLEHDDTTRALMGANMQRQAVPLLKPYAPIVGTGSEYKIAHDSGLTICAEEAGTVSYVDGKQITVETKDGKKNYQLVKYRKSNQDTCINERPIVEVGQKIAKGQTLTDGPAMHNGELALGRNPLVAFMTWHGYNFEDAIIISERLVKDDVYTSIAIEEHVIKCLRTKNGDEEITRDIPNSSDESKRYLDENGIIAVGAEVKEGDVLVGKISPKGQTDYSPEEKLLNAIFGNKTKNYRDSSLRVPHGGEGIVAKVERFSIFNNDLLDDDDAIEIIKVYIAQKRKLQIGDKMSGRHGNKGIVSIVVPVEDMPYLADGTPVDILLNPLGVPSRMNIGQIFEIHLGFALRQIAIFKALEYALEGASVAKFVSEFGLSKENASRLIKEIKSYCSKNKIKTYEEAKKQINNIKMLSILKTVGLNFEDLNYKAATPVFSGANLNDISGAFAEAGMDAKATGGKIQLYDGRTGEPFDGKTTVGVMYMMKLDHMVDDKIHARTIGPYSKITQQPLGGKSQNGGQRFGEMEVWAMEAYGAAYNLQELLTIKSDDVKGRNLTYSSIIKNKAFPTPSLPETFKLLTKQLQGLCLQINVYKDDNTIQDINSYTSVIDDSELSDSSDSDREISVETTDYERNDMESNF